MHLEPLGDYLLVSLDPTVSHGAIWTPPKQELGRRATVTRSATPELAPGDRVLIAYLQAIQVGDELLVSRGAVLAKLAA